MPSSRVRLLVLFLAILFALLASTPARAADTVPTGVVRATPMDAPLPVPVPRVEVTDRRPLRERFPDAPRVSLLVEAPTRADLPPADETRVLAYDCATGEVVERRFPLLTRPGSFGLSEPGAGMGTEPQALPKNFSDFYLIPDPTIAYYPRSVKVEALFRDVNGFPILSVSSGTFIDPQHVITAAHCVYAHSLELPDGWHTVNNYAEEVEITPGYMNGSGPWGSANSRMLYVWPGWIDDHDYDHDIAFMDLDRPLGAIAGWWAYGYSTACDFFESDTWVHDGYPAAAPYDGEYMYENMGSFDDCNEGSDYQASWDNDSGGGTSGSGAIKAETSGVYAVHSTGDETSSTDTKISPAKFDHITAFLAADQSPAFDLVALDTNGPAEGTSGLRLDSFDFLVLNYSGVTQSGTWNFSMYLSEDDVITPTDLLLGSAAFNYTFVPNGRVRVTVDPAPFIPATTPGDWYWLGVHLEVQDADVYNNLTIWDDASRIHVECPAPAIPVLLAPSNGMACGATDQLLSWEPAFIGAEYDVQFGLSCGDGPTYATSMTSWSLTDLAPGTTYLWRVRSRSQCGYTGSWSTCWSFSTLPDPTDLTTVVSPTSGAHCQPVNSLTLDWEALPWAETYDLQLSPAECGVGSIITGITESQRTVSGLLPNTTYYWHVRAHTVCGQTTDWSPMPGVCWTFKTAPSGVATPVQLDPADGTTCGSPSMPLTWTNIQDMDHYEVQVGTSCGTGPIYTTSVSGFTAPGLVSGEVYYWRVRTFHECGLVSPWTGCWSFSLDLEPPTNPTTLTSSTHTVSTWSGDNTIDVAWDFGSDNCASFPWYGTVWDTSPTTQPTEPNFIAGIPEETSPPLADGQNHWFHLRAIDWAGNPAVETMHLGPFWIDRTGPSTPVLDYATLDAGQIIGETTVIMDWLPCTDAMSGLVGYSWAASSTPTPPASLDNIVDGTDLYRTVALTRAGNSYLWVRAVDAAGNGSGNLMLGPITVDFDRFGIFISSPARGDVLTEGSVHSIRWGVVDEGSAVLRDAQLSYALNPKGTWVPIATLTPTLFFNGRYDWTVPAAASDQVVLRLTATDDSDRVVYDRSVRFTIQRVTGAPEIPSADRFFLGAARPNPFNPQTTIEYAVPYDCTVALRVYDAQGRLVRTLVSGIREGPALHTAVWDGRDDHGLSVASGVYRYSLEAGEFQQSRSMVLVK